MNRTSGAPTRVLPPLIAAAAAFILSFTFFAEGNVSSGFALLADTVLLLSLFLACQANSRAAFAAAAGAFIAGQAPFPGSVHFFWPVFMAGVYLAAGASISFSHGCGAGARLKVCAELLFSALLTALLFYAAARVMPNPRPEADLMIPAAAGALVFAAAWVKPRIDRARRRRKPRFQPNGFLTRPLEIKPEMIRTFCDLPFNRLKVMPNGDVNSCCYQNAMFGNVLTQTLDEIWHSEVAVRIRQATLKRDLDPVCLGWRGCPFIAKEKTMYEMPDFNYPVNLEFGLPNTFCNIGGLEPTPETACIMCTRADPEFAAEPDLTMRLVERLKPLVPYLNALCVLGTAEPFWKGRVFDILDAFEFEKEKHHILFWTISNGTVFDRATQDRFLATVHKSFLIFSLDAATPETYRKIRRLKVFDRICDNLAEYCRKKGPNHGVHINNNINLLNVHETVQMVELADRLGVRRVQLNPTYDSGSVPREILINDENAHVFAEAEAKARLRARELGIFLDIHRPLGVPFPSNQGELAKPKTAVS